MSSSPLPALRLSQRHLNLLTACPRKFQHSFIEQLEGTDAIAQQDRLLQGARFHLLLQQWLLDLPVDSVLVAETQFHQWLTAFRAAAPQILDAEAQQQPESDRTLEFAGYLLTVRYDLLLIADHHAKILDWKTYPRPKTTQWLEQNWQTRLYPFVLAETSAYLPEQISMVYWFFEAEQATTPQSLTFPYNTSKHEQTRQELTNLLNQLSEWLDCYQAGKPFPQVGWESSQCAVCSFAARCGRVTGSLDEAAVIEKESPAIATDQLPDLLPNLAEIAEVPL